MTSCQPHIGPKRAPFYHIMPCYTLVPRETFFSHHALLHIGPKRALFVTSCSATYCPKGTIFITSCLATYWPQRNPVYHIMPCYTFVPREPFLSHHALLHIGPKRALFVTSCLATHWSQGSPFCHIMPCHILVPREPFLSNHA